MEIISLYLNIFISKSKFLFQFRSYRIRYLICFLRYPINPCLLVYARSRYCLPDWIYLQQNRTFIKYTTEKKKIRDVYLIQILKIQIELLLLTSKLKHRTFKVKRLATRELMKVYKQILKQEQEEELKRK